MSLGKFQTFLPEWLAPTQMAVGHGKGVLIRGGNCFAQQGFRGRVGKCHPVAPWKISFQDAAHQAEITHLAMAADQ